MTGSKQPGYGDATGAT